MAAPPLVRYSTIAEYRSYYKRVYCQVPITTFDGIEVRFRSARFNHCFFESSQRNSVKDKFSIKRAQRIDWIKAALQDSDSELFCGWDRKKKKYDKKRRVTVISGDYVVVIRLTGSRKAEFVTAYVADTVSTIERIRKGPKWKSGQ